jgi:flagellar basal-body rod modification protein FlgD
MTSMIATAPPAVTAAQAGPATEGEPKAAPPSKQMFLELLIAQLRHQNPLEPMDGADFLSQLAQFSALEQMVAIREEIASLRAALRAKPDDAPQTDSQAQGEQ